MDDRRWKLECGYEGKDANEPWWFDALGPIIPKGEVVEVMPAANYDALLSKLEAKVELLRTTADGLVAPAERLTLAFADDLQAILSDVEGGAK